MREATGTQDYNVADRIINQVANAQVFPRPRDGDHLTKAIAVISEMAPQNVTEAMLTVQMQPYPRRVLAVARRPG